MRLRTSLEGDLDSILLRSLRKELEYRYTTIDQIAGDLQSYLAREPVKQGKVIGFTTPKDSRESTRSACRSRRDLFVVERGLVLTVYQAETIAAERDKRSERN